MMENFKQILVAVDLSADDRFVGEQPPPPSQQAICQAEWLAQLTGAKLTLFYALSPRAEQLSWDNQLLMGEGDVYKSVMDHAVEVLAQLTVPLKEKGIDASSKVVFGKDYQELVREVDQNNFDLVIAGTRRQGPFRTMLFGSTGIKLLRNCPSPVWITKPAEQNDETVRSILVAHDMSAMGERALEVAGQIAKEQSCDLHVLHAFERPDWNREESQTDELVLGKIEKQLASLGIEKASIHIVDDSAAEGILNFATTLDIDLVVMGTIARAGLAGVLVGNTSEKILPFLPCSILAIKPKELLS